MCEKKKTHGWQEVQHALHHEHTIVQQSRRERYQKKAELRKWSEEMNESTKHTVG